MLQWAKLEFTELQGAGIIDLKMFSWGALMHSGQYELGCPTAEGLLWTRGLITGTRGSCYCCIWAALESNSNVCPTCQKRLVLTGFDECQNIFPFSIPSAFLHSHHHPWALSAEILLSRQGGGTQESQALSLHWQIQTHPHPQATAL